MVGVLFRYGPQAIQIGGKIANGLGNYFTQGMLGRGDPINGAYTFSKAIGGEWVGGSAVRVGRFLKDALISEAHADETTQTFNIDAVIEALDKLGNLDGFPPDALEKANLPPEALEEISGLIIKLAQTDPNAPSIPFRITDDGKEWNIESAQGPDGLIALIDHKIETVKDKIIEANPDLSMKIPVAANKYDGSTCPDKDHLQTPIDKASFGHQVTLDDSATISPKFCEQVEAKHLSEEPKPETPELEQENTAEIKEQGPTVLAMAP